LVYFDILEEKTNGGIFHWLITDNNHWLLPIITLSIVIGVVCLYATWYMNSRGFVKMLIMFILGMQLLLISQINGGILIGWELIGVISLVLIGF